MATEEQYFAEEEGGLGDLLDALKRGKKLAALTSLVVLAIGGVTIFAWPTAYTSTATILIEDPEVPQQLVQTTVTTFAAQQIQYINQRVMTRTNLANIIEKFDLYRDKRKYTPTLLLTDEARENIKLDLITVQNTNPASGSSIASTIAFTIGFEDENAGTAQKVANELVSLYMEENVRSRTVQTVETRQFLSQEADLLEQQVASLEQDIGAFKEANEGSLPQTAGMNAQSMQRLDAELLEIDREIKRIDETRILLDAQLVQIEPTNPKILPDGSMAMSSSDQLKSLQTRFATLKGQYSDQHPDVLRIRREIEALKAETGLTGDFTDATPALVDAQRELAIARENYGPDHPEVVRLDRLVDTLVDEVNSERQVSDALIQPDNPAYIQLTAQRGTLTSREISLNDEKKTLRARLRAYEERLLKAPIVEQQLAALQRQLQSATAQYFALRDRQFSAVMGEALETQSKGERFVLVEPANMPLEPSSPNRPVLIILLLFVAPSFGIGLVIVRRTLDQSIWGASMLDSIQGAPPIAEIPLIMTAAENRHSRRTKIAAFVAAPICLMLFAVIVHFALRPLDVLWFVVMRKLGI